MGYLFGTCPEADIAEIRCIVIVPQIGAISEITSKAKEFP
jgi:hypothetical protein